MLRGGAVETPLLKSGPGGKTAFQLDDEFAPLDLVVDLALDDYAYNQYELSLCLREILAVRFMNDYFVTPHKERSDLPVPFAKTYTQLLEAVMETVHAPWLEGGKEQFFKVLDRFYPDGGTDYFRKNFAQYFSAPLAASY